MSSLIGRLRWTLDRLSSPSASHDTNTTANIAPYFPCNSYQHSSSDLTPHFSFLSCTSKSGFIQKIHFVLLFPNGTLGQSFMDWLLFVHLPDSNNHFKFTQIFLLLAGLSSSSSIYIGRPFAGQKIADREDSILGPSSVFDLLKLCEADPLNPHPTLMDHYWEGPGYKMAEATDST